MKIETSRDKNRYGTDLTGDPVYDYLKREVLEGNTLLGGLISVPTRFAAGQPRKMLKMFVRNNKTQKVTTYEFPYNKIQRGIPK